MQPHTVWSPDILATDHPLPRICWDSKRSFVVKLRVIQKNFFLRLIGIHTRLLASLYMKMELKIYFGTKVFKSMHHFHTTFFMTC